MKMIKKAFIFSIAAVSSLFGDLGEEGWMTLPRPQQRYYEDGGEEDDPSLWVVFSKAVEGEKILIRFPADPVYSYGSEGTLEAVASGGGETHLLRVFKKDVERDLESRAKEIALDPACLLIQIETPSDRIVDILYRKEGKWIAERLQETAHHLYFFQTASDELEGVNHRQFIGSFDVQAAHSP